MSTAGAAAARGDSWRGALAAQLAEAVFEQVECRAAATEESLWLRGQREICSLRDEQAAQKHQMRHQLAACAEACRGLEHENAVLRRGIEVIVKHLGQVLGRPPAGGGGAPRAQPPAPWSAGPAPGRAVARCRRGPAEARPPAPPEDPFTPSAPPIREEQEEDAASDSEDGAPPSGSERERGVEAAGPDGGSLGEGAETFSFTLRRAPDVPLGLEVCGDDGPSVLTVRAVRPGGAVEAWNRQMPAGDRREVRVGDRIVQVNAARGASGMRGECVRASLLRIVVVRSAAEPTASYI